MLALSILSVVMLQTATTDPDLPRRSIVAEYLGARSITVDGRLDDPVWVEARFVSEFHQKEPVQDAEPSDRMEVAIAYDDEAIYVGARMFGEYATSPGPVATRRDTEGTAERIAVFFDTYHDRRTAYAFAVTRAGVRLDWYHPEDDESVRDFTYEPVWTAKVRRRDDRWTAEMRIPLSQLRFTGHSNGAWGLNVSRVIPARNEQVFWVVVPRHETGWSSRFGVLGGLDRVTPAPRIEAIPYLSTRHATTSRSLTDPLDPFNGDGRRTVGRGGVDLKIGLGPNFTLDATVNPDFAQVDADPAVINLSAFETVFEERRPFFTEGSQLLRGNGPTYFYSRRIGAPPTGSPSGDYVDGPKSTTILGAAKVTGRMQSGLSLGALAAVTDREYGRGIDLAARTLQKTEVEPTAGFGVIRLQQELGQSRSTIGATLTGHRRGFSETRALADRLTAESFAGGVDWRVRLAGGEYEIDGHAGMSRVSGSDAAIARLQLTSTRYFQRPDQHHITFDPTRRSMTGWTGALKITKRGGRHWLWGIGVDATSPEFEINDVGQLSRADRINGEAHLTYRETTPRGVLHRYDVGLWVQPAWNFGGFRSQLYTSLRANGTFRNFWDAWLQVWVGPGGLGDRTTRGGPLVRLGKWWYVSGGFNTNPNQSVHAALWADYWNAEPGNGGWQYSIAPTITVQPAANLNLSATVRFVRWLDNRQYVATLGDGPGETFGQRYVFAFVDRNQISSQIRGSFSITPDVSVDLYVEPFAASGRYFNHGELMRARSFDLRWYGTDGTTVQENPDGSLAVTDGPDSFTLPNRDFNAVSFRSNAVLRWEWRPGSTLFLVWQRDRSAVDPRGELITPGRYLDTLTAPGVNVMAVKVSYWLN